MQRSIQISVMIDSTFPSLNYINVDFKVMIKLQCMHVHLVITVRNWENDAERRRHIPTELNLIIWLVKFYFTCVFSR